MSRQSTYFEMVEKPEIDRVNEIVRVRQQNYEIAMKQLKQQGMVYGPLTNVDPGAAMYNNINVDGKTGMGKRTKFKGV